MNSYMKPEVSRGLNNDPILINQYGGRGFVAHLWRHKQLHQYK